MMQRNIKLVLKPEISFRKAALSAAGSRFRDLVMDKTSLPSEKFAGVFPFMGASEQPTCFPSSRRAVFETCEGGSGRAHKEKARHWRRDLDEMLPSPSKRIAHPYGFPGSVCVNWGCPGIHPASIGCSSASPSEVLDLPPSSNKDKPPLQHNTLTKRFATRNDYEPGCVNLSQED